MNYLLPLFTFLLLATSCTAPASATDGEDKEVVQADPATPPANSSSSRKTNKVLAYVSEAPSVSLPDQLLPPFDTVEFDRVVAFDFNKVRRPFVSVLDLPAQRYAGDIEAQQALDKQQVAEVLTALSQSDSYGGGRAACFDPRMGFVFYQGSVAKMVVDICLDCNFLRSSIEIPATINYHDFEGGRPLGFSTLGRERIIKLAKALGLHYGQLGPEKYEFVIGG
ncbi:MAG: hypothetical protein AAFY48_00545 [Bacteroidota bacterium]